MRVAGTCTCTWLYASKKGRLRIRNQKICLPVVRGGLTRRLLDDHFRQKPVHECAVCDAFDTRRWLVIVVTGDGWGLQTVIITVIQQGAYFLLTQARIPPCHLIKHEVK